MPVVAISVEIVDIANVSSYVEITHTVWPLRLIRGGLFVYKMPDELGNQLR
jgi:hypothetical protein